MSRVQVLSLYRQLLRKGQKFHNYNFREYSQRRIRSEFKENMNKKEPNEIQTLYQKGLKEREKIFRQQTISSFYGQQLNVAESWKGSTV